MTEHIDRLCTTRVQALLAKELTPVRHMRARVDEQALQAIETRVLDSSARPSGPLPRRRQLVVTARLAQQAREQAAPRRQRQPGAHEF
jgi:hypothetical protein